MSVYIKECDGVNVKGILPFLRKDIEIYNYEEGAVLLDDIVFCSREDVEFLKLNKWKYKCLIYEDIKKEF